MIYLVTVIFYASWLIEKLQKPPTLNFKRIFYFVNSTQITIYSIMVTHNIKKSVSGIFFALFCLILNCISSFLKRKPEKVYESFFFSYCYMRKETFLDFTFFFSPLFSHAYIFSPFFPTKFLWKSFFLSLLL